MSDSYYALEKLNQAVRLLAIGEGDVRSRLNEAYLVFHPVQERDFPDHLKKDWMWICEQLTRFEPPYEGRGRVEYTLSKIQNRTGRKIAERIVTLYHELESYLRLRAG